MKRFTATEKWADPWYRGLTLGNKALWQFICDQCEPDGVWTVDYDYASAHIGAQFEDHRVKDAFGERIIEFRKGKWWIVKFIEFQYGSLSKKCTYHRRVWECILRHGIADIYQTHYPHSEFNTSHPPSVSDGRFPPIGRDGIGNGSDRKGLGETIAAPPGFPESEQAAKDTASFVGCTPDFAGLVWNEAMGRGYRDRSDTPIRAWQNYLKSCWNRRADWEARNGLKPEKAQRDLKEYQAPRRAA